MAIAEIVLWLVVVLLFRGICIGLGLLLAFKFAKSLPPVLRRLRMNVAARLGSTESDGQA